MNPVLRFFLLLFLSLPLPLTAQDIGTVTLLEGNLRVIRGTTVYEGLAGTRLRRGDIVQSSENGFVQLEFAGGTIIALGPSTGLFLLAQPSAHRSEGAAADSATAPQVVMLNGWIKGEGGSGSSYSYATPLLAAAAREGTLVFHASATDVAVFIETGSAALGEVSPTGNWRPQVSARGGQYVSRKAGKSLATSSRPEPSFVESMPLAFRDSLPSRLSRFAGKPVEPKRAHEVTFAEVQPWLTIAQNWRKGFVTRFEPRLQDAAFRKALEAHISDYPEWDPILHPEKYRPKTSSPTTGKSESSSSGY